VRTRLRSLRGDLSLAEASERSGVSRPELSRVERGMLLPLDLWTPGLVRVYGPVEGWYARRLRLLPDVDCAGCGRPLPPEASSRRRFHDERCRSRWRRRRTRDQEKRER
jgi:hypothetical protein